jgi:queuosine precursor transporter
MMNNILKYKYTAIYIVLIVLVNWGFTVTPLIPLPTGDMFPPMSLVVGFVFVSRDFAQREIGHSVIVAMLVGAVLSYFMADPYVALASLVAFLISEGADWAIYTWTKKPFAQRILLSSIASTPIDSAVFLAMIGHLSATAVVVMTLSKMIGAIIIWKIVR